MSFSPALLAAAREAAPVLAKLRAEQPEPVRPEPTATPTDVAWAYLRSATRPHGLLKRLCAEAGGVDYDAARSRIQKLREKHCVL